MTTYKPPKQEPYIGKADVMREDWGFLFSDNIEDWKGSKRLLRNRKNKDRYIKKVKP